MAALKKGTATGRQDMFGEDILIGDKLKKVGEGTVRFVNKFGGLSDENGTIIYSNKSWKSGDYEVLREKTDSIEAVADPAEDVVEEAAPVEAVPVIEAPEAVNPTIDMCTDAELLQELKERGFSGELIKTFTVKQKFNL